MNLTVIEKLNAFREKMKNNHIDIYIIPSSDPHLSEYVADRFKSRAYMTGFTGSAGTAVISATEAALFTDGRYFIQAEKQLKDSSIKLIKMATPGHPTLDQWIKTHLKDKMTLAYDGRLFAADQIDSIKANLENLDINYVSTLDIVDIIWTDRPPLPSQPAFMHEHKYTGAHIKEKLARIRRAMDDHNADIYLLNSLNDIAWLFNIRGNDVENTPIVYAYALITDMSASIYIDQAKVGGDLQAYFIDEGISVKPYTAYYDDLAKLSNKHIILDPNKANGLMFDSLNLTNKLIKAPDLTYMEKSCFTEHELTNVKHAHIKDGVAMVHFLHWLDTNIANGISEFDVKEKVTYFRSLQEGFIEASFESIAAYAGNAAMMHYSAPKENSAMIKPKGLFLLDSGGQYYDGTTDITRTIAVGPLTDEEKHDFTLVLKGHSALDRMIFLSGATGSNLDTIARQPIWAERMDYKSGTGHSVGYLLSVHDGPARIRMPQSDIIIKAGMVLTNEPGIYKQDKHGIRTENMLIVRELETNSDGLFLNFETITFCPIDRRAIEVELLTQVELDWINNYHHCVFTHLSPYLEGDVLKWLEKATAPISC